MTQPLRVVVMGVAGCGKSEAGRRIADTLGLAQSNIAERVKGAPRKRGPQNRPGDLELTAEIRRLLDTKPTYGHRRLGARAR